MWAKNSSRCNLICRRSRRRLATLLAQKSHYRRAFASSLMRCIIQISRSLTLTGVGLYVKIFTECVPVQLLKTESLMLQAIAKMISAYKVSIYIHISG